MEFPRTVFHSPGQFDAGSYSFDHLQVTDKETYEAALRAGWFATVPEAVEKKGNKLSEIVVEKPKADPKAKADAS